MKIVFTQLCECLELTKFSEKLHDPMLYYAFEEQRGEDEDLLSSSNSIDYPDQDSDYDSSDSDSDFSLTSSASSEGSNTKNKKKASLKEIKEEVIVMKKRKREL